MTFVSLVFCAQIILVAVNIFTYVPKVECVCEDTSLNYTCVNGNIIPCTYFQDKRNDCEDNSDEGYLYTCRSIGGQWQFKCTMTGIADNSVAHCQVQVKVYDLYADCSDYSDEQLYVGDTCQNFENVASTTGCELFMTESYCNTSNQCACRSGTYVDSRNADCVIRKLGDSCSVQADCEDASSTYRCLSNVCACKVGYKANADNVTCDFKQLNDTCTSDVDCSNFVTNSECSTTTTVSNNVTTNSSTCQCTYNYKIDQSTGNACIGRLVGDSCEANSQCNTHLSEFGFCDNVTCGCMDGSYSTNNDSLCQQVFLFENCTTDLNCSQISYGECRNDTGTCQCLNSTLLYDYRNRDCAFGLGDLRCDSTENCTTHFNNSDCNNLICGCATGYYSDGYYTCIRLKLGDGCMNASDCSNISNAECDMYGFCQCLSGYYQTGDYACDLDNRCTNFACTYPWGVALIVLGLIGLVAIGVVVGLLIFKKVKFAKFQKDEEKGSSYKKFDEKKEKAEKKKAEKAEKAAKEKAEKAQKAAKEKAEKVAKAAAAKQNKALTNGIGSPTAVSVSGVDADIYPQVMVQRPPTGTAAGVGALNRGRLLTPVEKTRAEKVQSANPLNKKKKGKKPKKAISETDIPSHF